MSDECSPILKEGLYHFGDSCSNVLNKINIISASGFWGINVSKEHFLYRGRILFGDVFLFIINTGPFRVLIMSL